MNKRLQQRQHGEIQAMRQGWRLCSALALGLGLGLLLAGCASDPAKTGSAWTGSSASGTATGQVGTGTPSDPNTETADDITTDENGAGTNATVKLVIFNASRHRMGAVRFAEAADCKGVAATDRVIAGEMREWELPVGQPFSFGGRFMSNGPRKGRCLAYATFTPEADKTYQAFWRASEANGRCSITLVDKTIFDETGVLRDATVPFETRTPAFPKSRQGAFCQPLVN